MKKINKMFSCLLACTIFSTITLTSVSATKEQTMFLFDEELSASKSEDAPAAAVTQRAEGQRFGTIRKPVAESPLEDKESSPVIRSLPKPLTPSNLDLPPAVQVEQLAIELQTEESMRQKKQEFRLQYQKILEKKGSHLEDIHKWKYSIFLYLKTLRIQSYEHTKIISDIQILNFFINMVKEFNPSPLPNFDLHDYRIRFDHVWGLSGAIICSPEDDPCHVLALL